MYRSCLYLSFALAIFLASTLVNAQNTGVCTGYPKMYNGKPCASTTRYWDGQKGACGCGTSDTSPFSWQWTKPTAAASAPIFGASTWCGSGCGKCFQLTPTAIGASAEGTGAPALTSLVVKITNLCPYGGNEAWCAYDVNSFGYDAHFDLMDYNMDGLISSMGWNNPEVTYEEVDCEANGYVDWGCQCADEATSVPTTPTTTPTTAPTNAPTNAATTKVPTAAPTKAPTSASTKAPTAAPTTSHTAPTKAPTSAPTTSHTAPTKAHKPKVTTPAASPSQQATSAPTQAVVPTQAANQAATTVPTQTATTGSFTIQTSSGSNGWWFGLSVANPASSGISSIEITDTNGAIPTWTRMAYQGNDYWNLYSIAPGSQMQAPFSLRITTTSGQVTIANNIITSFSAVTINVGVAA